jgi:hypothetical protein
MKRKWIILAIATLACLAVAGLVITSALLPPVHGITREVTDRIQIGMTPAEVEAVMGMPPGFYRFDMAPNVPGRQKYDAPNQIVRADNDKVIRADEVMFWYLEDVVVIVHLDGGERVVWCDAHFLSAKSRFWRQLGRLRLPDW